MGFGCEYASKREAALIKYIGLNFDKPTYSDNLKNVVEFREACTEENDLCLFDFVRVAILDLKAAGLIVQEKNGWKLTTEGWKVYTDLMEDDIPF